MSQTLEQLLAKVSQLVDRIEAVLTSGECARAYDT